MIPADALNSVKALGLAQKPLVTATSAVNPALFEPGQKYQASVQAQLAPGIFKVKVGEQLMQLQLPGNIRSGDTLMLQVVALLPRLTFTMATSANPLSTAEQLSATARLLSSLTQQPYSKNYVPSINSAPLWTGGSELPDSSELASKLHTALSQSGLFYESHQAQWLAGARNTAQLMQEPQNQAPDKVKAAFADNVNSTNVTENHASPGQARISIPGIPDHLQPLIQQQLNALDTRQVQWQGQVWPEQEMHWKIHEESARSASGEEGRQWVTQIQLTLPNLGAVNATLRFSNGGVSLLLDAEEEATRSTLGAASTQLIAAMSERGIKVASTHIKQPGQEHGDAAG
jgi:hypothetical protein